MPGSRACGCGIAVGDSRKTARITSVVAIPLEARRTVGRALRKRRRAGVSASVITSFTRAEESAYTTLPLIGTQLSQRIRQRAARQRRKRIQLRPAPIADRYLAVGNQALVGIRGLHRDDPSHGPSAVGDLNGFTVDDASYDATGILLQFPDANFHGYIVEH